MARFVYIGGRDWDDTELPAATTAFGLRFVEGVERDVGLRDFRTPNEHEHAIRKLSNHPHFKRVEDVVVASEEPVPVKRTWSRKKKAEPEAEAVNEQNEQ